MQPFARTVAVNASVTLLCLLLGYPVAYLLAPLPEKQGSRLMMFVIVPFWTSLLVRSTAWYVLLRPGGVINSALLRLGVIHEPVPLIFNRTGVLIGMTHILLPYMIFAIYSVMKNVSPSYMRVTKSLAALGLSRPGFPLRAVVMPLIILPMIVPIVVVASGFYLVFAPLGLVNSYLEPGVHVRSGHAGDEIHRFLHDRDRRSVGVARGNERHDRSIDAVTGFSPTKLATRGR